MSPVITETSAEEPDAGGATPSIGLQDTQAGDGGHTGETVEATAGAPPQVGRWGAVAGLAFWGAVGLTIALLNDVARSWLQRHLLPMAIGGAVVVATLVFAVLRGWLKGQTTSLRAAVFLLAVVPGVGIGAAGVFFWMPTSGQLITLRGVVLVVLVLTPALMWWLFLATQRVSLLNEFLSNLARLGLLIPLSVGGKTESEVERRIRVTSYLQRFEGTYGRLPDRIYDDIRNRRLHGYTREVAREQPPLATAAVSVSLTVVVLAIGWIIALPPIDSFPEDPTTPRWLLALSPNQTATTFAFLGAYFFSMQMLFRRYVRGDLRGSAYVAVVLRVILAVIGVWVISAVGTGTGWTSDSQLLLLSFVIGVFPMIVWQVIRGAAAKIFQLVIPSLQSQLPLSELDGLTVWHESRLEEEDIENVPNMATADIVDLLINTRIPANRIVEWVDQAILLTLLGPDQATDGDPVSVRKALAQNGVRTASALLMTASGKRNQREAAALGSLLLADNHKTMLPSLIRAVRTNSNLPYVLTWRGLEHIGQSDGPRLVSGVPSFTLAPVSPGAAEVIGQGNGTSH